ncbi:TonB-dependent receptor [Flavihumibacter sp. CACIAM 22H1]|uniref:TonB-dependent receptor n=1 Tax=Flavihumibacter sp. CACIAM 22H1 TaxID=1812911 RepID=UPI0007A8A3A9|nr:TonB-dependent receptor [Flavihumibacter sp. CACIAM 22H1]KYP13584.1 MAG: TonB-dependent receptor [Flavihumibacter sp. CACIAM 22H1]
MKKIVLSLLAVVGAEAISAQEKGMSCRVVDQESKRPVAGATIQHKRTRLSIVADSLGNFSPRQLQADLGQKLPLLITAVGYGRQEWLWKMGDSVIYLQATANEMDAVVVSGTMRAVTRSSSPVPVEVYTAQFLRKNPSPSLFDALQLVNGVRPQLNCNVCNTGDIHINGLEGPYTMVLIDGMPIVSSLATVYGLQGIPSSLVERIEVVKGPASSLYGSEAMGGLINVITKTPDKAPRFSLEYTGTSWREHNVDAGLKIKTSARSTALLGLNYFNYTHRMDKNGDNFTDLTLQNRLSFFSKINWNRAKGRQAGMAVRFITEDRWGGEMQWTRAHRGGDERYGEQISTNRLEWIGNYQLPTTEKLVASFSATSHRQRSAYGTTLYDADQYIGFGQLTWEKKLGSQHEILSGIVTRYTYYDDNTPATRKADGKTNQPDQVVIPGLFVQDDIKLHKNHQLLAGFRYDYDKRHGSIYTPRLAYKWKFSSMDHLRLNLGTGFRVVNLFTEEHAALTGAREVVILDKLKPERSYNASLNYTRKIVAGQGFLNLEAAAWYTYFSNRIVPDYQTDPDKIIYANLDGYAESAGFSLNLDGQLNHRIRFTSGLTLQDVRTIQRDQGGRLQTNRQLLTERWSGTWTLSYRLGNSGWSADYTGSVYGPMLLPLLSDLDPRSPQSQVWSLQHLQLTKKIKAGFELFGGIKNLLNFTPDKGNSFLIARANDPFDKNIQRDASGAILVTPDNPYALSFDPTYVYAPNQGRRVYVGIRVSR